MATETSHPTASATHSAVCTLIQSNPSKALFGDGMTLQGTFILVGGICTIVTIVAILLVELTHLVWRTNFAEQRQLMRIVLLPVFFAVCSWFSVQNYGMGVYLDPISKVYESYAVTCFFFFMVQTITHTDDEAKRQQFFIGIERLKDHKPHNQIHDRGSLRWYRIRSMMVYQTDLVVLVAAVLLEVVAAALCPTKRSTEVAKVALSVVTFLSVFSALFSKLAFYRRFRPQYDEAHILKKFLSFKGMVWLIIHQQLILEILNFAHVAQPTEYMTLADFSLGIPEFMIMCECAIFSIFFLFSLSGFAYRPTKKGYGDIEASARHEQENHSVLEYLGALFWPSDIFKNIWYAMKTFFGLFKGRGNFDYTGGSGVTWNQRQGKNIPSTSAYEPYSTTQLPAAEHEIDYDRSRAGQAYQKVHLAPYPPAYRDQSPNGSVGSHESDSHESGRGPHHDQTPLVASGYHARFG